MNLYTIIFEFKGGTYIEQKLAKDETNALLIWSQELEIKTIKHMGKKVKDKIIEKIEKDIKEYPPVLLSNCRNVWCAGIYCSGLVNIIKTEN